MKKLLKHYITSAASRAFSLAAVPGRLGLHYLEEKETRGSWTCGPTGKWETVKGGSAHSHCLTSNTVSQHAFLNLAPFQTARPPGK